MQCFTCKEEASLQCCNKEFCQVCIGSHMMQLSPTRHRPAQFTSKSKNSLTPHIQSCLTNELLELEEFKKYSLQIINSFLTSLQSQVVQVCESYQNQVLQKCAEYETELKNSLSCLLLRETSPVLELFKDCHTAEDVKKVKIFQKTINCDETSFYDLISDSVSFQLTMLEVESGEERPIERMLSTGCLGPTYSNVVKWHHFPAAFRPNVFNFVPGSCKIEFCKMTDQSFCDLEIDGEVFPSMAAWCVSEDSKLILAGGFEELAKKDIFVYSMHDKKTEKFPKMCIARYNHSQLALGNYVYAIGGSNGSPLRDCERLNLNRKEWSVFSKLVVARENPASCHYSGKIFVFGGAGIESIEWSYVKQPCFNLLNLRMPGPGKCCVFVHDTEIVVLHKGKSFKFLQTECRLIGMNEFELGEVWSSCEPVVRHNEVGWIAGGRFLQFSLKDFTLAKLK